jgi:hypothetical protein
MKLMPANVDKVYLLNQKKTTWTTLQCIGLYTDLQHAFALKNSCIFENVSTSENSDT